MSQQCKTVLDNGMTVISRTPTKGPLDISMHFDRLGAELNAFTSKEYTCYYARFVDDKLEDALSVLAEMVIESNFSQDAIDTEREVVIEEIARSDILRATCLIILAACLFWELEIGLAVIDMPIAPISMLSITMPETSL